MPRLCDEPLLVPKPVSHLHGRTRWIQILRGREREICTTTGRATATVRFSVVIHAACSGSDISVAFTKFVAITRCDVL